MYDLRIYVMFRVNLVISSQRTTYPAAQRTGNLDIAIDKVVLWVRGVRVFFRCQRQTKMSTDDDSELLEGKTYLPVRKRRRLEMQRRAEPTMDEKVFMPESDDDVVSSFHLT